MKKKLLLSGGRRQYMMKEIAVFDDPERLKAVLNKLSWKILQLLSEKEMYPMEVAKKRNWRFTSRKSIITSESWRESA